MGAEELNSSRGGERGIQRTQHGKTRILHVAAVGPIVCTQNALQGCSRHVLRHLALVVRVKQFNHTGRRAHTHIACGIGRVIGRSGSGSDTTHIGTRTGSNHLTGIIHAGETDLLIEAGDTAHIIITTDNTRVVAVAHIGRVSTRNTAHIFCLACHTAHIEAGGGHTAFDSTRDTAYISFIRACHRIGVVTGGNGSIGAVAYQTAHIIVGARHGAVQCTAVVDGTLVVTTESTRPVATFHFSPRNGQILDRAFRISKETMIIGTVGIVDFHIGNRLVVTVKIALERIGVRAYRFPTVRSVKT